MVLSIMDIGVIGWVNGKMEGKSYSPKMRLTLIKPPTTIFYGCVLTFYGWHKVVKFFDTEHSDVGYAFVKPSVLLSKLLHRCNARNRINFIIAKIDTALLSCKAKFPQKPLDVLISISPRGGWIVLF